MEKYFLQKEFVSNSFLKSISGKPMPKNIERIFEFGNLVHALIFEPAKADVNDPDYDLAEMMKKTFYTDWLCKNIMQYKSIKHEHEFYRTVGGIKRRCKADAWIREVGLIVEFKGLAVTNEKAFRQSLDTFDYDMGAAWYIDTIGANRELIIAVSKKNPKLLYRYMVQKGDDVYMRGREKYIAALKAGYENGTITKKHIYNKEIFEKLIN